MRTKRLLLIACSLLLLGSTCAYGVSDGENASGLFAQGNSEYQRGNFKSAESFYGQMLDLGIESGPLYYNLGNACFKQKRLGDAIYYWEKAQQKLPGDQDVRENLDLASLLIVDRMEMPPDPWPIKILSRARGLLSIGQETKIAVILFVVLNVAFAVYLLAGNPRVVSRALFACSAFGLLFLIFACSLSWKIYEQGHNKQAIVIEQKVDVRSGPGDENIAVFTIHEGIKVRVLGSNNGWYQISLPNGWSGWLQQSYLRVL